MPCTQPQPCPAKCNADHHSVETFSQALTKLSCNSGHSEKKIMALSQSSKMSALAGQSICRAVTATPLQIYNIQLTRIHIWCGCEILSTGWPKAVFMSYPQRQYLCYQNSPLLTLALDCRWEDAVTVGELRGGGSGPIVRFSLKNLPNVCLEGIHGWSQICPLISVLATGLRGLPTPGFPVSRGGRWMHGR